MRTNTRKYLAIMMGLVLMASAFVTPARADQPFMRAALANAKKADEYLKKATADKGGYRVKARDLVALAITAINNGISYDQQNPNNNRRRNSEDEQQIFGGIPMTPSDQQNMVNARVQLQAALANLQKASADKGGYRVDAMNHIRSAIQAINDGIEYDRTH